ncbi:MAG: 3-isopropylmalate dehydratase [Holophagaceae bacterium]|uniref:3-isopropylmalate dehydratase n=1 Tax=Candidatus Geothrix odensensis TaxID=2954440 RepID=A0A936K632_9BACT|nr:3-isopropylmalate dehydratase [Candidatus Geothrix odensensis]
MLPDSIRFDGRILFLTEDPERIRRQLAGEDLEPSETGPLRDQISTDEITPAFICYHFDEKLGDFPYLGLKCGEAFPVKEGAVRAGGFAVSVAGKRRGKGSSREASPYAEQCAGIRLVIAESFERIYRQNAQNLGLLTSTDFGLIPRLRRGEAIPLPEFTEGLDPVTAEIVQRGGLFAYNAARLAGEVVPPLPRHAARPMTYAEKLLARHAVVDAASGTVGLPAVRPGDGLFAKADWRFSHEYVTPMAARFLEKALGPDVALRDADRILAFRDHLTFLHHSMKPEHRAMGLLTVAERLKPAQEAFCAKHGIRLHGELSDGLGSEGICHSLMAERYVSPGQLVVGTDSHTPHAGALGCLAFGVGTTDIANAWVTGDVRVTVPPTLRVRLNGRLRSGVSAKDLVLHLLAQPFIREGGAIGQVIEYMGEGLLDLDTDERATLTNMAAEIGGFTGLVAPDAETLRFIQERRGVELALEPWMRGDEGAEYAQTLDVDCATLGPMLARPGDPGNGLALADLDEAVPVHIAYLGSCTGGKREDLRRAYEVVRKAAAEGRQVPEGVRFFVQCGSEDVRRYAEAQGWMAAFEAVGAVVLGSSCGACINAGPGVSTRPDQVTISAINRNFPGRSGPGQMWLASPATVAASALAGRIVGADA